MKPKTKTGSYSSLVLRFPGFHESPHTSCRCQRERRYSYGAERVHRAGFATSSSSHPTGFCYVSFARGAQVGQYLPVFHRPRRSQWRAAAERAIFRQCTERSFPAVARRCTLPPLQATSDLADLARSSSLGSPSRVTERPRRTSIGNAARKALRLVAAKPRDSGQRGRESVSVRGNVKDVDELTSTEAYHLDAELWIKDWTSGSADERRIAIVELTFLCWLGGNEVQNLIILCGMLQALVATVGNLESTEDAVLVALRGIGVVCRFNRPAQISAGVNFGLVDGAVQRLCTTPSSSGATGNTSSVQLWCVHALFVILVNNAETQTMLFQHQKLGELKSSLETLACSDAWNSWPHNEARVVLTMLGFSTDNSGSNRPSRGGSSAAGGALAAPG